MFVLYTRAGSVNAPAIGGINNKQINTMSKKSNFLRKLFSNEESKKIALSEINSELAKNGFKKLNKSDVKRASMYFHNPTAAIDFKGKTIPNIISPSDSNINKYYGGDVFLRILSDETKLICSELAITQFAGL